MSTWESVAGKKCRQCRKNPATHWYGNTLLCCQCHGGDIILPEHAAAKHREVLAKRRAEKKAGG